MSTPSSTDNCQNDGSSTLLNNKDGASWHQMNEDTIKPEVNAQSEMEDEEDEVKTLEELQSTINRFPSIYWISYSMWTYLAFLINFLLLLEFSESDSTLE